MCDTETQKRQPKEEEKKVEEEEVLSTPKEQSPTSKNNKDCKPKPDTDIHRNVIQSGLAEGYDRDAKGNPVQEWK